HRGGPAPGGRRTSTPPAPSRGASGRDGGRAPPRRSARPRPRRPRPAASPAARGRYRGRGRPAGRRSARLPAADAVQGAAGLEPLDLLVAHGVRRLDLDPHATGFVEHTPYRPVGGEVGQTEHADAVVLL